jgi:hypothetical protein
MAEDCEASLRSRRDAGAVAAGPPPFAHPAAHSAAHPVAHPAAHLVAHHVDKIAASPRERAGSPAAASRSPSWPRRRHPRKGMRIEGAVSAQGFESPVVFPGKAGAF